MNDTATHTAQARLCHRFLGGVIFSTPLWAQAHPLHTVADFYAGVAHPWGGWDHWLVMLAIGMLAARYRGAARWGLPALFLCSMLVGTLWSSWGGLLPGYEQGILVSLGLMGMALLVRQLPVAVSSAVALLGVFHGYAHHAEMGNAHWMSYAAGFMLATALLHALGYGAIRRWPQHGRRIQAATGVGMLLTGAVLGVV